MEAVWMLINEVCLQRLLLSLLLSTMLFTSVSNVSTSTAATELLFGAPTTSTRTLGGIRLEFGLKFSGAGEAASTTCTTTSTTTTTTVTTSTTTTITSDFSLNLRSASTGINNTDLVGVSSVPLTSTVNSLVTPVMTSSQLDRLINKWSLQVEDREKLFLYQATQVNDWDDTLIENSEKTTALRKGVEKVKLDQKRLEKELSFILSQKKELEDRLTPAEESVKDKSEPVYLWHTDEKHERRDSQLKVYFKSQRRLVTWTIHQC
ncbi:nucleoporin-62 C-terminal-like protein isoform X2 [Cavia porcellus]|uniref:nucleoporin-62 C-terminal-like protein isoform X2 n=1 Tax=Cavia porcellus TaxID=10141 RepID=UPI000661DF60|nr:nucleoporin-62 C-terminal-like protein isoform X2 [Cavia porcellus]